jgi:glycosyltransferase involved in cell wall biosynthesis
MYFATKIIAVSESVRNFIIQWHRIKPARVVTLYNGIDINKYNGNNKEQNLLHEFNLQKNFVIIGFIGRLEEVKGLDYLLEAATVIVKKNKEARFLIVGEGSQKRFLQQKAQDLGIGKYIIFPGFREDVDEILAAIDILVMPSISEAFPTAILEAMASKKPVIATTVGGVPEIVVNRETGILIPAKNIESLANAIIDLMQSSEKRSVMGLKGRERVAEHFSIERMVENYENLYDACQL